MNGMNKMGEYPVNPVHPVKFVAFNRLPFPPGMDVESENAGSFYAKWF